MLQVEWIPWVLSVAVAGASIFLIYALRGYWGEASDAVQNEVGKQEDEGLAEIYVSLSSETFFILRVIATVVTFFLGLVIGGIIFAVIFGLVGFFAPLLVLRNLRRKRVRLIERQLVEGLELLGNGLKSGLTLPQAVELLVREFPAPISKEFALVLAESRLGVEFTEALHNMANRLNSNIVQVLASGVSVTKRCGGDLTVIFSNIAAVIREQANIEGKLDAVTAQGRFQGLILGAMPFALVVILYFIDKEHVETLFRYQIGQWAFVVVCLMVLAAQGWIRKLMQIDV